jgi:nucleoid-associated protein YgaU
MYARSQLVIWTVIIFVLNLVLLVKLRDNAATAKTQLEELTPTELSQIEIADLLDSNAFTSWEQEDESVVYESQGSEVKTEKSEGPPQFSLFPENASAGSVKIYYVHEGDTLWQISRIHNLDLRTLLAYNKLKNPNLIRPGQRIEIPRQHINMQVSP